MKIKTAIFPVGGLGTRFLPATKAMPKEMLIILDKPLIHHAFEEAKAAGEKLKGFTFDHAYASDLKRAQDTLKISLETAGHKPLTPIYNKALNERMYGDLQGIAGLSLQEIEGLELPLLEGPDSLPDDTL